MKAVVRIKGMQYSLVEEDVVRVPRLEAEAGTNLLFEDVLLVADSTGTRIGTPRVTGAAVQAVVVRHVRGPKIEVGVFKRRKDYRRHTGHRQELSEIRVTGITPGTAAPDRAAPAAVGGR